MGVCLTNKKMRSSVLFLIVAFFGAALAKHTFIPNRLDLFKGKVKSTETDDLSIVNPNADDLYELGTDLVNLGEELWELIEDNEGVYDNQLDYADALPSGVSSADDLTSWTKSGILGWGYFESIDSWFGLDQCNFNYELHMEYGGTTGKGGLYLHNVTVVPTWTNVAWGYTMTTSVTSSVYNAGESSDFEDIMGAITLDLAYTCN